MLIWCFPTSELDQQHLLGEHAELHVIVGSLLGKYKTCRNHPQTLRFQNRIEQLYSRHCEQVAEMRERGYKHHSLLPESNQPYTYSQQEYLRDYEELANRQNIRV